MKITTKLLDRAAFLMCYGGTLVSVRGKYPQNTFVIEGPEWLKEMEKQVSSVDYKEFCENRRVIKRRSRQEAGLPEYFTGERNAKRGFSFADVATVKSWKPNEKK